MNCPECKKEIPENSASCPNCGCPITPPEHNATETVIKQGFSSFTNANFADAATVIGGALAGGMFGRSMAQSAAQNMGQNGYAVLTDKRFVFGKKRALKKMTVGSSVNFTDIRAKGDIVFDIPIAAMTSVALAKRGLSSVLRIDTTDGAYDFVFSIFWPAKVCTEWGDAINQVLSKK